MTEIPPADDADPGVVAKLFDGLLMAVGGLIFCCSGLCSLAVVTISLLNFFAHPGGGGDVAALAPMVLLFGGVPMGVGAAFFIWGRSLFGARRRQSP